MLQPTNVTRFVGDSAASCHTDRLVLAKVSLFVGLCDSAAFVSIVWPLCGQMLIYLADDIHLVSESNRWSLRSSSDNMCAVPHVRTTALETDALALSAREFGTLCRAAYGHLTSATNILRRCWRHICFDKATALFDILYKHLRNILTYLLTPSLQV